jgi:hypothetical protein
MKNMLAIEWSRARVTNVAVGHQMAIIFETIAREEMEMKTAKQTSQLAGGRCVRNEGRVACRMMAYRRRLGGRSDASVVCFAFMTAKLTAPVL